MVARLVHRLPAVGYTGTDLMMIPLAQVVNHLVLVVVMTAVIQRIEVGNDLAESSLAD